jgi:hypothetical protein
MAHTNLSFEIDDPADPGQAEDWSISTTEFGEESAEFSDGQTPPTPGRPVEIFEGGWGNSDFISAFPNPDDFGSIFPKLFSSPPNTDREKFESGWQGNEGFSFKLSSVDPRLFNTLLELIEKFEREWDSNQGFLFNWAQVVSGPGELANLFNTSNDPEESFEAEWLGNESFHFTMPAPNAKFFHGNPSQTYEDFEVAKASVLCAVTPSTDTITASAHGFLMGDRVTFRNIDGNLPSGIQSGTPYVVVAVPTANTLQVAQQAGAPAVDIQDFGTGTHYIDGDPRFVWVGTDFMASL